MNDKEIELADEARRDQKHEYLMENDFDYFLNYIGDDIQAIQDAFYNVLSLYENNGWEFDIDEILEQ